MEVRLAFLLLGWMGILFSTNVSAAVGRTAGKFAVSPTGGAQYTIPVWTPPGIRGMQPNLALNYDSHLGYGMMGPGWTLSGFSVIARCNLTYAQDGAPAPITLTAADGLCLDGNRLRTTGTGVYQTEIANFSQVAASGTAGNGPSYFTVKGKDGLTYEYGNTSDSKILPCATPSSCPTPYIWALDKVTDRLGNQMTFTYFQAGGAYVPLSIQYTALSGSTSFPYQVNFKYTTLVSPDPNIIAHYIAGTQIQQTQQLSTITVTSSGTTVRKYNLLYTTSSATLRATLTSIQECGVGGTDCFLTATRVGYQSGTAGVASPATATGSGATNGLVVRSVDVDGDGRADLVYATTSGSNNVWWVQLATGSGYGTPIGTGAVTPTTARVLVDDFEGLGRNELLAPKGGYWYVYRLVSGAFTATSTGVPVDTTAKTFVTADVQGDGLPDIVSVNTSGTLYIQTNTSSAGVVNFSGPVSTGDTLPNLSVQLFGNNDFPASSIKKMDFDGDGRNDLVFSYVSPIPQPGPNTFVYGLLSRGNHFYVGPGNVVTGIGYLSGGIPALPVRWNDDECDDLQLGTEILIAECNGSYAGGVSLPGIGIPGLALDWDGDGRTDLLVNVNGTWQLYRSEGNTVASSVPTGISVGSGTWTVTDQNGDGLSDLILANPTASNALYLGLHNGAGVHPDLATSFTDGYGLAAKPSYVSIAQSTSGYSSYYDSTFPYSDYFGPLEVVSSVVFTDPSNAATGTYSQTYLYSAMWTNLQGRGITPFQSVQATDSRNGFSLYTNYFRSFPYTGMQNGFYFADPNSYPVSQGSALTWNTTPLDSTPNNQRYFPYVLTSSRYDYELRPNIFTGYPSWVTDTENSYAYDNYGNATTVTSTVTDTDPTSPNYNAAWTSTTVNSFTPNTTTWCLNLPTATTVMNSSTAPNGAAITRTVAYNNPDYTNCRETEKVIEPNSATYKVVEDYVYDTAYGNFGNLHSTTVTGVGMSPRVTTTLWTANGQFPLTVTNPLLQSVTFGFDPNTGMKLSQTDPNFTVANPLTTSWTYDNFARELSETRIDGTSTTIAYNACTTGGCVNSNNELTVTKTLHNVGGSTQTVENIYLDKLDRPLVTSSLMLNGAYDRNEVQYDSLGNVHLQGAPCTFVGCATYWTTNSYDALHRLTELQRPISATNGTLQTTTIAYSGRTTTITDPYGHKTTKINQVTGNLARSQDAAGYYQNFSYDAFGSLVTVVDSHANPLFTATYDYGIGAFQRNVTDMDLDKSTAVGQHRLYVYDALGELKSWTDAKAQSFSVTYDGMSRPLVRTEPDLTTTWTWGATAGSYNIGALQSVTASGASGTYTESHGYDSKTRPTTKTLSLPADATYVYTSTYNATTGLLDTLQYPVSTSAYQLKLQYGYVNGLLQKVSDFNNAATVFWSANTTNPRGQVTKETLGNGVVTNRAFDAVTGWVNSIQAGVGSGAGLLNSAYLFDEMGNVTQRQNNNLGLTENFYYDTLYRLDHSTLGSVTNLQMHYDTTGMGNIASRSDIAGGAAWTYDPVRKHAVTQAGSTSNTYTYDNNGNAITRNGNLVTWSSYNYPTGINSTGESVEFWYGPNRQRWKTLYTGSIGTETTYHVGKLLEKVANGGTIDYRHYIFAGNEPVAIYSRTSAGTNTLRYTLEDHQGSFASIVSSTGTTVVNENFSAFGNRRNATTWSGAPTSGDETTINGISREGYTGQTALGVSMGLNHMNGRVQDAITGRFLSPDPYVPDPGNTQSFNRYSYVNNNPLSFVDPSGFDPALDTIVVESGGSNPAIDVAAAVVDIAELFGLFGGGGPTLSPMQQAGVAHGINLNSPLQGTPSFQSAGGAASFATEGGTSTIPEIVVQAARYAPDFLQGFASAGGSFLFGNDASLAVSTEPSSDPSMLDQIDVNGVRYGMHGFDPIPLVPGGGALECIILHCSGGGWALAGIGMIPFASVESAGANLVGRSFGRLGTIVENPGIQLSGFAGSSTPGHAINQIISRGVTPSALQAALANPTVVLQQAGGRFLYLTEQTAVAITDAGQVVTAWGQQYFGPGVLEVLSEVGAVP